MKNADYKELYLNLFRATERAINTLIEAQQRCEERYLEMTEPKQPGQRKQPEQPDQPEQRKQPEQPAGES